MLIHIPGNSGGDFFGGMVSSGDPFQKQTLLVSIQRKNQKVTDFSSPGFGKVFRNPINLIVGETLLRSLGEPFFFFSKVMFFSGDDLKLENQKDQRKDQ